VQGGHLVVHGGRGRRRVYVVHAIVVAREQEQVRQGLLSLCGLRLPPVERICRAGVSLAVAEGGERECVARAGGSERAVGEFGAFVGRWRCGLGALEALRERSPRHLRVRKSAGLLLPRADAGEHGSVAPGPAGGRRRGGGGGDLAELVALEDQAEVLHAHALVKDVLAEDLRVRGPGDVLRRGRGAGERHGFEFLAQRHRREPLARFAARRWHAGRRGASLGRGWTGGLWVLNKSSEDNEALTFVAEDAWRVGIRRVSIGEQKKRNKKKGRSRDLLKRVSNVRERRLDAFTDLSRTEVEQKSN